MLHTKSWGPRPSGSGEEDFKRVFTIYGRGGHLGHVTRSIWTIFRSRVLRSLYMKFEFDWPSGFRGEDVWNCGRTDGRTTDGRRSDWYTLSSPMSLRLRWAKKCQPQSPEFRINPENFQSNVVAVPYLLIASMLKFLLVDKTKEFRVRAEGSEPLTTQCFTIQNDICRLTSGLWGKIGIIWREK